MMAATQYSFMANIPTVKRYRHRAWDLAEKSRLPDLPATRRTDSTKHSGYSHGGPADMLDKAQCKAWADQVKSGG